MNFVAAAQQSIMTHHRTDGALFRGDYAILDFETTGLEARDGHRVIEVAVTVIERDGRVVREFDTLVRPEDGVKVGPSSVHGISAAMLACAPTFAQIAPELMDVLAGNCVVAHNLGFEDKFLAAELSRLGVATSSLALPGICTLQASQRYVPGLSSYKLEGLLSSRGLELTEAHRARGDVRGLAKILPALLDRMPVQRFGGVHEPNMLPFAAPTFTREDVLRQAAA